MWNSLFFERFYQNLWNKLPLMGLNSYPISSSFNGSSNFDYHLSFLDTAVREAAKIIRLLQIHQLRELQTKINQSIVTVQMLSANPKTDQSLGKVGR